MLGRGRPRAVDRAGLLAGRLPGAGAAALRRAEPEADARGSATRPRPRPRPRAASWVAHPAEAVIDRMLDEFERPGKLEGAGFYEYADGKRTRLWPGLREAFPPVADPRTISLADLQERMLFIEAHRDASSASTRASSSRSPTPTSARSWASASRPGPAACCSTSTATRAVVQGFVARARELAATYGERFTPPDSLVAARRARREPTSTARSWPRPSERRFELGPEAGGRPQRSTGSAASSRPAILAGGQRRPRVASAGRRPRTQVARPVLGHAAGPGARARTAAGATGAPASRGDVLGGGVGLWQARPPCLISKSVTSPAA